MAKEGGVIFLSILATFGICAFLLKAANNDVMALTKQRTLKYELESRNEIASKLVSDYKNVATTQSQIENAFLPEENILEFVSAIESIASKRSIIHAIHFDTPGKTDKVLGDVAHPLTQVTFSLSLQSNIFIFDEFLKDLERLPYFVRISNITITSQGSTGWRDMSNVTIQGILFTRGVPQQL
jgi:hypothetical protein